MLSTGLFLKGRLFSCLWPCDHISHLLIQDIQFQPTSPDFFPDSQLAEDEGEEPYRLYSKLIVSFLRSRLLVVCGSQEVPKALELRASARERGSVCVADILEGSKSPHTQF